MSDDQALLIRFVRSRDAVAFNQLVQRYSGMVFSVARRVTGNVSTAEDVTQECFLTLIRQASAIRGSIPAWLHRVALNHSLNVVRKDTVRHSHEIEAYSSSAASGEMTWNQIAPLVDVALSKLPHNLREPVMRHFFLGRTQSQIAEDLHISQATVSRRLQEGIERLREYLGKSGMMCGTAALTTTLSKNATSVVSHQLSASLAKMALAGPAMITKTAALSIKAAGADFSGLASQLTKIIFMHKAITCSVIGAAMIAAVAIPLIIAQAEQAAAPESQPFKYGLYVHFDISTFAGYKGAKDIGRVPPERYSPTSLDVQGWVRAAKQAGMDFAVLTAKHEAGFCLWDCADYDYDVANSPNKTDVVAEFISACKAEGVSPGVHYSIPDAHNESKVLFKGPVEATYFELIKKQVRDLHVKHPDIKLQVFDLAARLSQQQLRELCQIVRDVNPTCAILCDQGKAAVSKYAYDTVVKDWFWSPDAKLNTAQEIYKNYSRARENGWPFLLNVGPDRSGVIPEQCIAVLTELKGMIDRKSTN